MPSLGSLGDGGSRSPASSAAPQRLRCPLRAGVVLRIGDPGAMLLPKPQWGFTGDVAGWTPLAVGDRDSLLCGPGHTHMPQELPNTWRD
jgi:hypothetical protein